MNVFTIVVPPLIAAFFIFSVYGTLRRDRREAPKAINEIFPFISLISLTKEEVESLRKLLSYSISEEEVESLRKLLLLSAIKEIHDIDLIIKQIPKLSNSVNELLVDVKKLEESIENVQDAVHSHTTPDLKKTIFDDYKNALKNHNDRLLSLQNRVEKYTKDDWLMLPQDETSNVDGEADEGTSRRCTPSPPIPNGKAVSTPKGVVRPQTPFTSVDSVLSIEGLSGSKSDALINNGMFDDVDTASLRSTPSGVDTAKPYPSTPSGVDTAKPYPSTPSGVDSVEKN
jgi:hypothetical protein